MVLLTLRCFTACTPIASSITAVSRHSTSTICTCSLAWKYPINTPSRSILSKSASLGAPRMPSLPTAGCLSARRSSAAYAG